jgi:hypothetical protein
MMVAMAPLILVLPQVPLWVALVVWLLHLASPSGDGG